MSTNYKEQLDQIKNKINTLVRTEFAQSYKNSPSNNEQLIMSTVVTQINTELNNMFTLSRNIDTNIITLNSRMIDMNTNIDTIKNTNAGLQQRLENADDEGVTSKELIHDYNNIYYQGYVRNWAIALSIIACAITIGKM